jgi:redox-sensitive bicupin YhaK (pirin superfamily)
VIDVTPLEDLGRGEYDWLSARYHFSFAQHFDPDRMGFGPLRVWNDDRIRAGAGFPMHPHRDMEIVTYIRQGAITHEDDQGNGGVTRAGDVQVMSAGTGIVHSEFNLEDQETTLFQIWIQPAEAGLTPRWETRHFAPEERRGRLVALASGRVGHEDALRIHRDAALLGATLAAGEKVEHGLDGDRRAYLVPARGRVRVNGIQVPERAGVGITGETRLIIEALDDAEVVLADLP